MFWIGVKRVIGSSIRRDFSWRSSSRISFPNNNKINNSYSSNRYRVLGVARIK